MSEARRVTILNQREGKIVLPADPAELKKNPQAKHRVLMSGQALEVSAEEAPGILRYRGLVDASKLVGSASSAEVEALKAKLAASESENLRLKEAASKRGGSDEGAAEKAAKAAEKQAAKEAKDRRAKIMKKGAKVCWNEGASTGVVVKVHKGKKGPEDDQCDVKLDENGNVSPFPVDALTLIPEASA